MGNREFESSVNLQGSKTLLFVRGGSFGFESSVNLQGSKTVDCTLPNGYSLRVV